MQNKFKPIQRTKSMDRSRTPHERHFKINQKKQYRKDLFGFPGRGGVEPLEHAHRHHDGRQRRRLRLRDLEREGFSRTQQTFAVDILQISS